MVHVRIGTQGRIVLPRELRDRLGAEEGEVYSATVEEGRLILESRDAVLKRLRDRFADRAQPDESVVGELIADRRTQAERERDV